MARSSRALQSMRELVELVGRLGPVRGWGKVSGMEHGASSQSTGDVLRWGFALKSNRQ